MTFAPCLCSTPKFVPVMNQPVHFILTAPLVEKTEKQRQLVQSTHPSSSSRPLKKCHRYSTKQFNASTAINRQHQFDNDTTIPHHSQHIFFCLPFKLFHLTKRRRRRQAPCYV